MKDLTPLLKLHPNTRRAPPICLFFDNFFSTEFCTDVISKCSPLLENSDSFCERYDDRRNSRCVLNDQTSADDILNQLVKVFQFPQILNEGDKSVKFVGLNKKLRFCKYDVGDHFAKHYDYYSQADENVTRFTVMIYLNEGFEGGETRFLQHDYPHTLNFQISPKVGDCIVFSQEDNRLLHEGASVTKGVKYILRTDAIYQFE